MATPAVLNIESSLYFSEREAEAEAARLNDRAAEIDPNARLAHRYFVLGVCHKNTMVFWTVVDRQTWSAILEH